MVPYGKMGTNEIGEFVSMNIREYIMTTNEKNLNEIYTSLLIIGERVLREDYRKKVESYILDDINHEAAADTVLAIMKDPEHFKDYSNFLYYYRRVLKNDFIDLFRKHKRLVGNFVYIDSNEGIDTEISVQGTMRSPEDALIIRDEVRSIVDNVFSFLQSNPRTSANAKYLVWPVLYAFLSGSNKIFDSLEFRDRCVLRMASTWAIRPSSNSTRNLDGKRSIKNFE